MLNNLPGESCIYHIGGTGQQYIERWCLPDGKKNFAIDASVEQIRMYNYYPETFAVSSAYGVSCQTWNKWYSNIKLLQIFSLKYHSDFKQSDWWEINHLSINLIV